MALNSSSGSGYWYGADGQFDHGAAVLQALREYRNAEVARRRSARDSMGMGETDILALRYLLRARASNRAVVPKDLSAFLGITSRLTPRWVCRRRCG